MNKQNSNNGITIISIVITIIVILILSFTIIYSFSKLTDSARIATLIHEMDAIETVASIEKLGSGVLLISESEGPQSYTEKTLNRFGYRPPEGKELYKIDTKIKELIGKDVNLDNYLISKNLTVYYIGNLYNLLLNNEVKEEDELPHGANPDEDLGKELEGKDEVELKIDDNIVIIITSCWDTIQRTAMESVEQGVSLVLGDVYSDHTGVYMLRHNDWLSKWEVSNIDGLDKLNKGGLIRLRVKENILRKEENFDSALNRWKDDTDELKSTPKVGSLYFYNNKLYACAWSSGIWTPSNPENSSTWIRVEKHIISD